MIGNSFREKIECNEVPNDKCETRKEFGIYQEYVESQKELFMLNLQIIIENIKRLQNNGEISEYVEVNARIKSFQSSYKNTSKKALDDIFGIEILTATEMEIEKILDNLKQIYVMSKYKEHDKENGYKAKHFTGALNNRSMNIFEIDKNEKENCPVVEIQAKTIEVAINGLIGEAMHSDYKKINKEEIQDKYNKDKIDERDLPEMWNWKSTEKEYKKLNKEEVLRKLYPFLSEKLKEEYKTATKQDIKI